MFNYLNNIEKWVHKIILILIFLILFSQLLLSVQPIRFYITLLDRLEGNKINIEPLSSVGKLNLNNNSVSIRIISPYIKTLSKAEVYLNGKKVGSFTKPQVDLNVKAGDKVTIDISNYSLDLKFNVITSGKIKVTSKKLTIKGGSRQSFYIEEAN